MIPVIYKNTFRKIRKSLGRYLSLFFIVMVGVGFFSGIRGSAPDIIQGVSDYTQKQNLMDFKIVSTTGLTDEDAAAIQKLFGIKAAEPSYSMDVLLSDGNAVTVNAMEDSINEVELKDGRMPDNGEECLADSRKYKVGDTVTIDSDVSGRLKHTGYTVVGTVRSPLYLAVDYGSTGIGDGNLYSYLYVEKEEFTMDMYTQIYVTASYDKEISAYSDAYDTRIAELKDEIKDIRPEQGTAEWNIYDRDAVIGYTSIGDATEMIIKVADIMPVFFILIVLLMTSNTMARMIMEERSELGILASLGFGDRTILTSYLGYVLSATLFGAVVGFFLGNAVIPEIIYGTFQKFIMPPLVLQFDLIQLAVILLVTGVIMSLVTFFFCHMELKQKPSALMRPVPPKNGQKIMLERIVILWKKLSFTWKVTMRNMFRYKQRVFMTIVGVAGCTALLVTGFGLKDSMNGVAQKQYGEIFQYDAMLVLGAEVSSLDQNVTELLEQEEVTDLLLVKQSSLDAVEGSRSVSAHMIVPDDTALFSKYYNLTSRISGKKITLDSKSVVITEKLADVFGVGKGDSITVENADNDTYTLTVSDVAENYVSNYIYLGKDVYASVFGEDASYNMIVAGCGQDQSATAKNLLESGKIVNITFTDDILQTVLDGNQSLDNVVVLIVVVAGLLVVIVLYNLTSINISERTREIATLKVLGFTDREANQYIYREAFLLTLLSIGIGFGLGMELHRLVIHIIEGDATVYFKTIQPLSFLWSFLIIFAVSVLMQILTFFKMKTIDMIESLKSVE